MDEMWTVYGGLTEKHFTNEEEALKEFDRLCAEDHWPHRVSVVYTKVIRRYNSILKHQNIS